MRRSEPVLGPLPLPWGGPVSPSVWPGADAQGAGVTSRGADPLFPIGSIANTVCVPTFTAQGRAKLPDPAPAASVAMVPSVRALTTMVKVSLTQSPDNVTVIVPPCPTVAGLTATMTVQVWGP